MVKGVFNSTDAMTDQESCHVANTLATAWQSMPSPYEGVMRQLHNFLADHIICREGHI